MFLLNLIFGCIALVAYLFFGLQYNIFVYSASIRSRDIFSSTTAMHRGGLMALTTFYLVAQALVINFPIPLLAVGITLFLGLSVFYSVGQPYYSGTGNGLYGGLFTFVTVLMCLSLFSHFVGPTISDKPWLGILIILGFAVVGLGLGVLVFVGAKKLSQKRWFAHVDTELKTLTEKPNEVTIMSPPDTPHVNLAPISTTNSISITPMAIRQDTRFVTPKVKSLSELTNGLKFLNNPQLCKNVQFVQFAAQTIHNNTHRFVDSSNFWTFSALFNWHVLARPSTASDSFRKAKQNVASFSERFLFFTFIREVEAAQAEDSGQSASAVFRAGIEKAKRQHDLAKSYLRQVWTQLSKDHVDGERIMNLLVLVSQHSDNAKKQFTALLKRDSDNATLLRAVGALFRDIDRDEETAQMLFNRANQLEETSTLSSDDFQSMTSKPSMGSVLSNQIRAKAARRKRGDKKRRRKRTTGLDLSDFAGGSQTKFFTSFYPVIALVAFPALILMIMVFVFTLTTFASTVKSVECIIDTIELGQDFSQALVYSAYFRFVQDPSTSTFANLKMLPSLEALGEEMADSALDIADALTLAIGTLPDAAHEADFTHATSFLQIGRSVGGVVEDLAVRKTSLVTICGVLSNACADLATNNDLTVAMNKNSLNLLELNIPVVVTEESKQIAIQLSQELDTDLNVLTIIVITASVVNCVAFITAISIAFMYHAVVYHNKRIAAMRSFLDSPKHIAKNLLTRLMLSDADELDNHHQSRHFTNAASVVSHQSKQGVIQESSAPHILQSFAPSENSTPRNPFLNIKGATVNAGEVPLGNRVVTSSRGWLHKQNGEETEGEKGVVEDEEEKGNTENEERDEESDQTRFSHRPFADSLGSSEIDDEDEDEENKKAESSEKGNKSDSEASQSEKHALTPTRTNTQSKSSPDLNQSCAINAQQSSNTHSFPDDTQSNALVENHTINVTNTDPKLSPPFHSPPTVPSFGKTAECPDPPPSESEDRSIVLSIPSTHRRSLSFNPLPLNPNVLTPLSFAPTHPSNSQLGVNLSPQSMFVPLGGGLNGMPGSRAKHRMSMSMIDSGFQNLMFTPLFVQEEQSRVEEEKKKKRKKKDQKERRDKKDKKKRHKHHKKRKHRKHHKHSSSDSTSSYSSPATLTSRQSTALPLLPTQSSLLALPDNPSKYTRRFSARANFSTNSLVQSNIFTGNLLPMGLQPTMSFNHLQGPPSVSPQMSFSQLQAPPSVSPQMSFNQLQGAPSVCPQPILLSQTSQVSQIDEFPKKDSPPHTPVQTEEDTKNDEEQEAAAANEEKLDQAMSGIKMTGGTLTPKFMVCYLIALITFIGMNGLAYSVMLASTSGIINQKDAVLLASYHDTLTNSIAYLQLCLVTRPRQPPKQNFAFEKSTRPGWNDHTHLGESDSAIQEQILKLTQYFSAIHRQLLEGSSANDTRYVSGDPQIDRLTVQRTLDFKGASEYMHGETSCLMKDKEDCTENTEDRLFGVRGSFMGLEALIQLFLDSSIAIGSHSNSSEIVLNNSYVQFCNTAVQFDMHDGVSEYASFLNEDLRNSVGTSRITIIVVCVMSIVLIYLSFTTVLVIARDSLVQQAIVTEHIEQYDPHNDTVKKSLTWKDAFMVDLVRIDEFHKNVTEATISMLDVVNDETKTKDDRKVALNLFLIAFFGALEDEEKLMTKYRIDRKTRLRHMNDHTRMIRKMVGAVQTALEADTNAAEDVVRVIEAWLTAHVLVNDRDIALRLNNSISSVDATTVVLPTTLLVPSSFSRFLHSDHASLQDQTAFDNLLSAFEN
ncbi:hypothetical protein BLNAU_23061 [Blattamonas nauphoetae]|uniref:TmcB/TmcC TPR repeats domain-containing protein n=1 Tax=Blattamonas nauphoetae TaxID=2049346 RepID=A0ABQ9WRA6_9EUKA|nr:hypothetical protein BLNAU_23061 [Blattamonas nauphoetae]